MTKQLNQERGGGGGGGGVNWFSQKKFRTITINL